MALLAAGALAADCPSPVTAERWEQELAAAESGYGQLDSAAFDDHLDAATLDLPCLAVVVPRADAARYHALLALRLYVGGDSAGAVAAFAAARAADPAWLLPEAVVPSGHEVRSLFERAVPGDTEAVPPPDGVTLWLDGARADRRPVDRPVIAQVIGGAGEVRASAYATPGEPLPSYPVAESVATVVVVPVPEPVAPAPVVPAPAPAPMPPPVPTDRRAPKWGLLAGAGVAGGVSGVLYGFATVNAAKFAGPLEPDVGREELIGLRTRTNGFVIGSVAAGAVAAASATLFVVALCSTPQPNPGDTIERYEVVRVVGQGGMAAVLEVRHKDLGTVHAMKLLQISAPGLHDRLLQEGRMQAQIVDPHICRVTDVVRVDGTPALVMELVQGPALDALLASYQPNLLQIDHLARGILAGVRAAHAAGLVHRDLKPANVLVDVRSGRVVPKVADFGLAKAVGDSLDARGGLRTRSGTMMGTPTFMAPEQARDARQADHRSDIFSVGAVLYELACGIPAFGGDDAIEVFTKTSTGDYRSLKEIAPHLPERMVTAIDRALMPDPAERWQDCDAMLRCWSGNVPDAEAEKGWELPQVELVRSLSPSRQTVRSSETFVGSGTDEAAAPVLRTIPTSVPALSEAPVRRRRLVLLSLGAGVALLGAALVVGVLALGGAWYAWNDDVEPVALVPEPPAPAVEAIAVVPVEPEPVAAVPEPRPRPKPTPAAAPTTGRVHVEGVDRAWLVRSDGERHKPGAVPPGSYEVLVFFEASKATTVMTLVVGAGDDRTVRCDAHLKACR